jgi:hypothetical protein
MFEPSPLKLLQEVDTKTINTLMHRLVESKKNKSLQTGKYEIIEAWTVNAGATVFLKSIGQY